MLLAEEKGLLNATRISGTRLELVSYKSHHIPIYKSWLDLPPLVKGDAQGSNPNSGDLYLFTGTDEVTLTTEEHEKIQHDWEYLRDRHLFIIILREAASHNELDAMIGDIGFHILPLPLEEDDGDLQSQGPRYEIEIDMMLVSPQYRGKGLGTEALSLFMTALQSVLRLDEYPSSVTRWIAKINRHNEPSIRLFKKMGFVKLKELSIFDEVWFIKNIF